MVLRFRLIDFKLFLTFCYTHRPRHLQLCAWSIEGRRVAESVYAGSWAAGPGEKTPRDPPLSGRYCRNETAEVRHAHSRVTQPAFSCCNWGGFLPSLNSVIMFTVAAEVLLSVAFSFLLFCDLSPLGLPQQQICYCQIHYMQHSLFIIYKLLYWFELWMWVTLMNLRCVFLQYREQLCIRRSLKGCRECPAEVPLFLSRSQNTQWPGGGCLRLGHSQLLGRPPHTGQCACVWIFFRVDADTDFFFHQP